MENPKESKFGTSEEGEVRLSPEAEKIEIDPAFFRQLKIIAERVGGDFGMKVEMGEPGKGSFFNPLENKITFDPLHVKENPETAQFIAAHEGGHRAITRGLHEIGLKDEKIQELYSQLGFAYGSNCCEDPADNNWFSQKFEGLKQLVKNFYDGQLGKENVPLGLSHPEVRQVVSMIGYIPRFVSFGSEVIRYWHQNRFSTNLDPQVKEALEKVKEDCQEYFETIPGAEKTEKETLEKAKQRFLNFYENIWPEMKRIIKLDIDDEKIRQMAENKMEDVLKQLEKKSKKELKDAIKQAGKSFKQEIKTRQKELEDGQEQGQDLNKEIKDLKQKIEQGQGEEKEELKKELAEKQAQKKQNKRKQKELKKELEEMKNQKQRGGLPLPMDKLSDELKNKLKEIFDELSDEEKEQLESQAQEKLENLEDNLNKDKKGKLNLDDPESHEERRGRIEKEQEEKERKEQEEKEIQRAGEEAKKKIESEMSEYDRYYQEVKPIIESLYSELQKIFLPQRHPRWKKGHPSGSRLDLLKAMQFGADRSKYTEIWERKTIPKKIDYRFSILVDLSGSMAGETIQETFKGMIVLVEVLNRIGIQFNIIGFQDKPILFKDFREELGKNKRALLSGMLKEPENKNTGGNNQASYNSDGFCLQQTAQELEKNKGRDNFLVVLSDGLPAPDPSHAGPEYDLHKVIKDIKNKTVIKLIGLGLGPNTEHVGEYYPNSLPNITIGQLAQVLAHLLQDMIRNPQKY